MTRKMTFRDRRMQMLAAASDAETIGADLGKYATILADLARFLEGEASAMERAEARFAQRAETKKATPPGRPSTN